MKRAKFFIEYPLCLSFAMALAWLKAGHQIWQEDSNDFPRCGGFDDGCFVENFPDGEVDWSDNLHLVPKDEIEVEVERLPKRHDKIIAVEDIQYCMGQDDDDKISQGCEETIERVRDDGKIYLADHADRYGPWDINDFLYADNIVCDGQTPLAVQLENTAEHLKKYGVTV